MRCGGEAIKWLARSHILIYQHIIIQSYYYVLSCIYHLPLSVSRVSLWDLLLTMNRFDLVVWHRERRSNKLIIYLFDVTRVWFRCFFFCFSSSVCLFRSSWPNEYLTVVVQKSKRSCWWTNGLDWFLSLVWESISTVNHPTVPWYYWTVRLIDFHAKSSNQLVGSLSQPTKLIKRKKKSFSGKPMYL